MFTCEMYSLTIVLMKTIIGIDNGTQSTKVLFYNFENKKVEAVASAPHDIIADQDGTREQKAEWWIDALKSAMSKVDPAIRKTAVAVGVSGQQHGFVPLDAAGEVLYNVKLWNDTSTAEECEVITRDFGGNERLLAETGNLVMPGYTIGKVAWLKNHRPEEYKRLATILLPHDYLNFFLTGKRVMEYGDASGTGFLDIRTRTWSKRLLSVVDPGRDLSMCLPELVSADTCIGTVTSAAAEALGIPAGIPVSTGGGDNMMGAIGTGTVSGGVLTMSLGTSGTLYGYSDVPVIDNDGLIAAFCSSTGGWLPLVCTMNCTVATELVRGLFDMSIEDMEGAAKAAGIGASGVTILPFFNGERTPSLPKGKGCIMGLDAVNYTKQNLVRASMESAIFGLKGAIDSFVRLGFSPKQIRLIGGGSKSALWRQIAADVTGFDIVVPENGEAAALGGALQALWMLKSSAGETVSMKQICDDHVKLADGMIHHPDPESVKKYKSVYAEYEKYLGSVRELFR